ncbi:unnamed protein product [Chironomus riparius]|uniref:VWFA domain-containing protein n=1 Tax=Chironomus riparius TaxID=315576 RepID=A0A9N9RNZ0_9DIPT|nr:unnamed protein product [Chironomus riparius]
MSQIEAETYKLDIYPVNDEFLASIDTSSNQNVEQKNVETVVILDRSGSMGGSVVKIIRKILPKFFEILKYDPEQVINLIAFESRTVVHKIKIKDFHTYKMFSAGGTVMAPAVTELRTLFEEFKEKIDSLRIVTISDGMIADEEQTKVLGDELATFASDCNILVNSQAVRFFTSRSQPDTTALCSLLQLNNIIKSQMIDVDAIHHHDKIAGKMADLFINDGFGNIKTLKCNNPIFYAYPWKNEELDRYLILPNRLNVFWLKRIPNESDLITICNDPVHVAVKDMLKLDVLQKLINAKLDYAIDRMKILKIVDTESAKNVINQIVEYFKKMEDILNSLIDVQEVIDEKSIIYRARMLKLNRIRSRKITTYLETIANDDKVNELNAAQKASYLRSVEPASKTGKGLARRAAKRKGNLDVPQMSFIEIIRKEVENIKEHFDEIKDIDYKDHAVSFYSQATTIEGLKLLIELSDDPDFMNYSADDILQLTNIVGIACNGSVGDFPDPSTWRMNEIYYGCHISVADIITSIHQSADTEFKLKAPGCDKEITNSIPIFDDPKIGVFLKKYAPSILEYSSSIGMRRVIADVPMTLGYTIIAGIRRMIYDLNKNKSTVYLDSFKQLVSSAASFVGKYYDHIEELLVDKDCAKKSYYLANNGIANLIVPLIRIYNKENHEAVKRIPDIMRSIYSCEIWKGISKEFRGKIKFNDIVKDMMYKLLCINVEKQKVHVKPLFEPEPDRKDIKFPEEFAINQGYVNELTKPLYYHNYMTLLPKFLHAATKGSIEDIKDVPEMTKTLFLDSLDIKYCYKDFIFLNVFQALRYPRNSERADQKTKEMKMIDLKDHKEALDDVKKYVRDQFEKLYDYELKAKRRIEETEMARIIVEMIISETDYQAMIDVWKNGMERNGITYKIATQSSNGFRLLCRKLIDTKLSIPLRSEIIKVLFLGVDWNNEIVYNKGKICDIKNVKKFKKRFMLTSSLDEWNEIEDMIKKRPVHVYREKENRCGHGNSKPSYWALGYNEVYDYLNTLDNLNLCVYYDAHRSCCNAQDVYYHLWSQRYEAERGRCNDQQFIQDLCKEVHDNMAVSDKVPNDDETISQDSNEYRAIEAIENLVESVEANESLVEAVEAKEDSVEGVGDGLNFEGCPQGPDIIELISDALLEPIKDEIKVENEAKVVNEIKAPAKVTNQTNEGRRSTCMIL